MVMDDHPLVAQGIIDVVHDIPGIAGARIGDPEAYQNPGKGYNQLWIIDLELGKENEFDVIHRIRDINRQCRILVYTMHEEPWVAARLAALDVDGAVSKSEPIEMLRAAVAAIAGGKRYFSPAFTITPPAQPGASEDSDISEREKQVLRFITQGKTSEEMAEQLGISINTILTYRRRLMNKFDCTNSVELVYQTKGLI